MKRLKQPLKWAGGKYYLAKRIIELMPVHRNYCEPYFGGGAVLLAKPTNWRELKEGEGVSEVINDIFGPLQNFWRVLQCPFLFEDFTQRIMVTPFSEAEFDSPCPDDQVEAAVWFFVRCRQSRQGLMKDFATLSTGRVRAGINEQVSSYLGAIDGLADVHQRLQGVFIFNRNARNVIRQCDGPDTFFYLDPPYLTETRLKSCKQYAHEMTVAQHEDLLKVLQKIEGKFILSGYPSALYNEYSDKNFWTWEHIEIDNKASSKKKKDKKTECLWRNFDGIKL